MSNTETITVEKVRVLVEAGALQHADIVGVPGGWTVRVRVGMSQRVIRPAVGAHPRLFRSSDAALNALRDMGLRHASIDLAGYDPAARH